MTSKKSLVNRLEIDNFRFPTPSNSNYRPTQSYAGPLINYQRHIDNRVRMNRVPRSSKSNRDYRRAS